MLGEGAWRETGYKSPGGGGAWKSIQFPDFPPTHQLIGGVTLQLEQALKPLPPKSAIGKNSLKDKGNFFICSQNNFIACSSFCYTRKSFFASTCTFGNFWWMQSDHVFNNVTWKIWWKQTDPVLQRCWSNFWLKVRIMLHLIFKFIISLILQNSNFLFTWNVLSLLNYKFPQIPGKLDYC